MQIISLVDSLQEMSNYFCLRKIRKKYFKMSCAKSFTSILSVVSLPKHTCMCGYWLYPLQTVCVGGWVYNIFKLSVCLSFCDITFYGVVNKPRLLIF